MRERERERARERGKEKEEYWAERALVYGRW